MFLLNISLLIILPHFWDITGIWLLCQLQAQLPFLSIWRYCLGMGRSMGYR